VETVPVSLHDVVAELWHRPATVVIDEPSGSNQEMCLLRGAYPLRGTPTASASEIAGTTGTTIIDESLDWRRNWTLTIT